MSGFRANALSLSALPVKVRTGIKKRFFAKIRKTETCWNWTSHIEKGYGRFYFLGKNVRAHRLSYIIYMKSIPQGLTIDHLCRNRACVNPSHLEPVTNKENILRGINPAALNARKTHCPRGHEYTEENIYRKPTAKNERACKICIRNYWFSYKKRNI